MTGKRRSFNPERACICGRVGCKRHGSSSNWARYVRDHPERARLYKSIGWKAVREQQLAEHPGCTLCGQPARHVDHITPIAEGGLELDPGNLQSLCATHHRQKTLVESHRGMKRAAQQRRAPP